MPAKPKSDIFTFEHDGKTYESKPVFDVLTPGFLRKNRKLDGMDQFFTMLEALLDDEALAVVDDLPRAEFTKLQEDFTTFLEATQGE